MKRREFITLVGGAAAWPLAARGQTERIRRIGWLEAEAEGDETSRAYSTALFQALAALGWDEGRNLRIERRFGYGNTTKIRSSAAELAALTPDVIITTLAAATRAMQLATQTIPIVFTGGGDAAALERCGARIRSLLEAQRTLRQALLAAFPTKPVGVFFVPGRKIGPKEATAKLTHGARQSQRGAFHGNRLAAHQVNFSPHARGGISEVKNQPRRPSGLSIPVPVTVNTDFTEKMQ